MPITLRHIITEKRRKPKRLLRPIMPSTATEIWYRNELIKLAKQVKISVDALLVAPLKTRFDWEQSLTTDSAIDEIDNWLVKITGHLSDYFTAKALYLAHLAAKRALKSTDDRLAAELKRSLSINVKPFFTQSGPIKSQMDKAIATNVDLIKSIPVEYLAKVKTRVIDHYTEGARWETMVNAIHEVYSVTESRAKLIARDQMAKMNSSFNQVRQESVGIEEYIWQTSGDERVRPTHVENDGKTFRWDSPPEETGHVGSDVNCRCNALPVINLEGFR